MICIDSSTCIEILRGHLDPLHLQEIYKGEEFAVASPTIFELYNGLNELKYLKKVRSKRKHDRLEQDLHELLESLYSYPLDDNAAMISSRLFVELRGLGKEIEAFDCLIAGVMLANGFKEIVTKNPSHFSNIKELLVHPNPQ